METRSPFNANGGLTLVPLPGFEEIATELKNLIEAMGERPSHKHPYTDVDIAIPKFLLRPSDETYVKLDNKHICGHDCVIIGSGPGTDQMIMSLLWGIGYVTGRHAKRISIITGYFPQARSDADEGEDVLTLPPMILNMANIQAGKVGIHRWLCVDPHSKQVSMAGNPGQVTPIYLTRRLLSFALKQSQAEGCDRIILAFPDDSASKRFAPAIALVEEELGIHLPTVTAFKRRFDAERTEIQGVVGETDEVNKACILMFDDEIATGGSVIDMAKMLKQKYGAKSVWACATHAVMCGNAPQKFWGFIDATEDRWVDHLVLTDTIPVKERTELKILMEEGYLSVYSWLEDLAWIIIRNHLNNSLRGIR